MNTKRLTKIGIAVSVVALVGLSACSVSSFFTISEQPMHSHAQMETYGSFDCYVFDSTVIITGYTVDSDSTIVIPPKLGGKAVTEIQAGAFNNCTDLTSVTIPNSVTSIDILSFDQCTNLRAVYFEGEAPEVYSVNTESIPLFNGAAPGLTIYHRADAKGWTNPWQGYPTAVY